METFLMCFCKGGMRKYQNWRAQRKGLDYVGVEDDLVKAQVMK